MSAVEQIALLMGIGWASGLNLYAAVFMLGIMNATGQTALPADLQFLSDPLVLVAAGAMYCVEFFADKIPGADTGWDTLHTFIRIPAGAVLAMRVFAPVDPASEMAAFLVGGSLASISHFTKAGTRILINASPEPFSNWVASIGEDLLVFAGLWAALQHPLLYIGLLVAFVALTIWLLPKLWAGVRSIAGFLRGRGGPTTPPAVAP